MGGGGVVVNLLLSSLGDTVSVALLAFVDLPLYIYMWVSECLLPRKATDGACTATLTSTHLIAKVCVCLRVLLF